MRGHSWVNGDKGGTATKIDLPAINLIIIIYVCCLYVKIWWTCLKRTSPFHDLSFSTNSLSVCYSIWNTWDTWTTLRVRVLCGPLLLIQWACPSAEQSQSLRPYCLQIGPRRPSDAFSVITIVPLSSPLNNTTPALAEQGILCRMSPWHHKASNAQFEQGPCRLSLRP